MDPGIAVMLLVELVLVGGFAYWAFAGWNGDQRGLIAFAESLAEGQVVKTAWNRGRVEGRLDGRAIRLEATHTGRINYAIELQGAVTLEQALTKEAVLAALAAQPTGALAADVRGAVQYLAGNLGLQSWTVSGGWLTVQRKMSSYALSSTDSMRSVFAQMAKLAPLYEGRELEITLRGEQRSARVWTAGGDHLLCPYCRDGITPADDALEACGVCRTLHHTDCFAEAGGCVVFACAGGPAKRQPA